MTGTQALHHPWLRRRPLKPRPIVERLESTKDNLRSCVDRWGDQSPSAFIVQSPIVKELETDEPRLPPNVVIPTNLRKESVLSPKSPHSPLPKKIKLQTEGEDSTTKPGKKKDSKPGSNKSKSPSSSISGQTPKPSPVGKKQGNTCESPTEDRPSSSSVASLDQSAHTSSHVKASLLTKLEEPQSPSREKMECDVSLTGQMVNHRLSESLPNELNKSKIETSEKNIHTATELREKENKTWNVASSNQVMASKTGVSRTSTAETRKEVNNPEPKETSIRIEPKSELVKNTDINSNYLKKNLSSVSGPVQKSLVQSLSVPLNLPTVDSKQQNTLSVNILKTGTETTSNPPTSPTPLLPTRVKMIPVTLEDNSNSGKSTNETSSNKPEEKPKAPKQLGNNISGLKSIWGSKISANEPKHHPIVKYNRTLSSPAPNTAKIKAIGLKPQKLEESEQEYSSTTTSIGPKVILHRIEVEDSKDKLPSSNKSLDPRLNPTNSISNKASDSSNKKPINEWVNDRLLHDRFNIDRRASDISSLVNSDSFYEDTAESVGSRLAEEISRITDKFCHMNDKEKGQSDKTTLMAQERHDKITDLLNGKRRPKYRRITHLNRDVPLGSMPPPTNLTYYLTNCLTSNSKSPLWAGTGCDFFSAPGTPVGSPRSPSEGSLDADIIFQMLSERLKADSKLQNVTPAKKTGFINT